MNLNKNFTESKVSYETICLSHISQNIGKLRCHGIIAGDPISFESSIILQPHKLFRYRHLHDKIPEFTTVEDPLTENNINPCIMKLVKLDGDTGYSRINESFASME